MYPRRAHLPASGVECARRCGIPASIRPGSRAGRDDLCGGASDSHVPENTFQGKLEDLRQRYRTFEQLVEAAPGPASRTLPKVLAGLQRSLEDLQIDVAVSPERECAASDRTAATEGVRSKGDRPERGLQLNAASEQGPILVRIMDTETHCRWVNGTWLEFTGRKMDELLGQGWIGQVHPDDREGFTKNCHAAITARQLYSVEYRLRRENGEYGWVLEIGAPRLTLRGEVGGYLGTAIEITEHKQTESRLAMQYAVARVLSESEILEEAATPILRHMCETLGWDVGELWSVDVADGEPRCARVWANSSLDVSAVQEGSRTRAFPPCVGPPWQTGIPVWVADMQLDEHLAHEPETARVGLRGMFRLPVSVHGEIRAILRVFSREVRPQDAAVVEFMGSVGVQIGTFLERRLAIEKIRESEARKAAILEASLDAVITIDHEGRVVEFNTAAETLFGYSREDTLGRELLDLVVPTRLRDQASASLALYRTTGENGFPGKRFGTFAMRSDGSEFPIEVALVPIGIGTPPLLTMYLCDATARKDAEQEVRTYQGRLRSLMADLLLAEEYERRRLAVDLHDGLSQTIALTRMKLAKLRLALEGRLDGSLAEIESLIDQANHTARSISFELSPPVLQDFGLQPAVQWLVENIQSRYGIEIALEDDGQPKPADEKTRVILFRSIRELLINAAKHAGARRVHVRLQREKDQVNASVEDDGVGMAVDLMGVQGSGLFSIHERLSHVGGSMRIDSGPGRGTKVHLRAPLASPIRKEVVEA
ncbi:MAG: PAS domain S-box protein [Planctomycetota bacterium]